jgi:hypothetical protein
MALGRALTIGLNAVNPKHYGGWSGELNACEADAQAMAEIVRAKNVKVKTLLTRAATRTKVMGEIARAAKASKAGDFFMLSYSGHGGQLPDLNNNEPDEQDETWCLYDGELVDDELYAHLAKFARGVRIVVFSDSCHSGTVVKLAYYQGATHVRGSNIGSQGVKYRFMPPDVALNTYRHNKGFYDKILKNDVLKESEQSVKAAVLLISGCQDNQLSSDGDFNGLFTLQLLRVWKHGAFTGDYRKFYKEILRRMPPDQTPNYFRAGAIDEKFEAQTPFTI